MHKRIKEIKFVFLFLILLFCFANSVFASTSISSDILEDTNWTLAGSPYIVENTVSVAMGATLTIDSGVVIKIKNTDSFFKNAINVYGRIIAIGADNKKIYFTSYFDDETLPEVDDEEYCYYEEYDEEDNPIGPEICETYDTGDPYPNDWKGIYFYNADGSVLNNVILKYGGSDVLLFGNSDVDLQNLDVSYSQTGITIYNDSHIDFLGGNLTNLGKDAIVVFNDSSLNFDNIRIANIQDDPVSVFNNSSFIGEHLKIENIFSLNNVDVIALFNHSNLSLKNSTFKNCPSEACITFFDGFDYLEHPSSVNLDNITFDGGLGSGLLTFGDSNINAIIKNSLFKDFSVFAVENYADFTINAKNNDWNHASGPYHESLNEQGLGEEIYGNVDFDPWIGQEEPVPDTFYAKIKDAPNGIAQMYSEPSNASTLIKTFPNDWILKVFGNTVTNDGWVKIQDMTDESMGWMQQAFEYEEARQGEYERVSSIMLITKKSRANKIVEIVKHYYDDRSTSFSLYSSNDKNINTKISLIKDKNFPVELLLAIIAQESSIVDFDNENVSLDYGHGIMQITFNGLYNEEYSVITKEHPTQKHQPNAYFKNNYDNRGVFSKIFTSFCRNLDANPIFKKGEQGLKEYYDCYKNAGLGKKVLKPYKNYKEDINNPKYKQYTNTEQSMYANIKDGLGNFLFKIKTKCPKDPFTPKGTSIQFTCEDVEKILTVWGYNGFAFDKLTQQYTGHYLGDISDRLKGLSKQFIGITYNNDDKLIEKLKIADGNKKSIKAYSPVEIQVISSSGKISGTLNEDIFEEIPNSLYDPVNEGVVIFFPEEEYSYKVIGVEEGNYGLSIDSAVDGIETFFGAIDLSIIPGEIHIYKVDEKKLKNNEPNAVSIAIDKNGDGTIERIIYSGNTLTSLDQEEVATSGTSSNNASGAVGLQFLTNNTALKPMVLSAQIAKEEEIKIERKDKNIQKKVVKKVTVNTKKKQQKITTKQVIVPETKTISLQVQVIDSGVKLGWFRRLLMRLFNY